MKKSTIIFSLITLMGGLSVPVFASQQEISQELASLNEADKENADAAPPSSVITTANGEVLGAVVDFIFDLRANRILYAVGVLQSPEKSEAHVFILPWSTLQVANDTNSFILKNERAVFQKAANFPLNLWLNLQPAEWRTTLNAAWKEKKSFHGEPLFSLDKSSSRASDLVDRTVKSATGKDIGALAELLIDPEKGSISYAIVSFNSEEPNSDVLFYPLPWSAIQVDPVQLTFVVPNFIEPGGHDYSFSQVGLQTAPTITNFQSGTIHH